jgi:hypothetical protein
MPKEFFKKNHLSYLGYNTKGLKKTYNQNCTSSFDQKKNTIKTTRKMIGWPLR